MGERKRLTTLHGCLKHERRRYVLCRLENEEEPLSLDALAEGLVDREHEGIAADERNGSTDRVESAEADESEAATAKQDAMIELYHCHLPRLVGAGLVRYDHEERVELAEYPAELIDEDDIAAG